MIYTVEIEKPLKDFEFQGRAEYLACAVDLFNELNGLDPWDFLNDALEDLEVEEGRAFTEHEINYFMSHAIPILLGHDFEPSNKEEVIYYCDKANCSVRAII